MIAPPTYRCIVNGVELAVQTIAFGAETMGDGLAPVPFFEVVTETRIDPTPGDRVSCELALPGLGSHAFEATVWRTPGPTDPYGDPDNTYRFAGLPTLKPPATAAS